MMLWVVKSVWIEKTFTGSNLFDIHYIVTDDVWFVPLQKITIYIYIFIYSNTVVSIHNHFINMVQYSQ